jgi:hypothetical protein
MYVFHIQVLNDFIFVGGDFIEVLAWKVSSGERLPDLKGIVFNHLT